MLTNALSEARNRHGKCAALVIPTRRRSPRPPESAGATETESPFVAQIAAVVARHRCRVAMVEFAGT